MTVVKRSLAIGMGTAGEEGRAGQVAGWRWFIECPVTSVVNKTRRQRQVNQDTIHFDAWTFFAGRLSSPPPPKKKFLHVSFQMGSQRKFSISIMGRSEDNMIPAVNFKPNSCSIGLKWYCITYSRYQNCFAYFKISASADPIEPKIVARISRLKPISERSNAFKDNRVSVSAHPLVAQDENLEANLDNF